MPIFSSFFFLPLGKFYFRNKKFQNDLWLWEVSPSLFPLGSFPPPKTPLKNTWMKLRISESAFFCGGGAIYTYIQLHFGKKKQKTTMTVVAFCPSPSQPKTKKKWPKFPLPSTHAAKVTIKGIRALGNKSNQYPKATTAALRRKRFTSSVVGSRWRSAGPTTLGATCVCFFLLVGYSCIWMFPKIVVPPKSSILIGFSIINPFWGTTIFGNTHIEEDVFLIGRVMYICYVYDTLYYSTSLFWWDFETFD